MQSLALSYARYMFYKDKGIKIYESNYNKLFIEQKQFEKQYGITNQELLERYEYNKYQERKSVQKSDNETLPKQEDIKPLDDIKKSQSIQLMYQNIYKMQIKYKNG